ncbi:MAG: hypothetical protein Q9187_004185 [Circinaria calcarea]
MNRFYFGGSDSSGSDPDEDNLPYPKPLARSAFLTRDFDPTAFLSSLHNRHQTLEDLRTELRTRSQELNKELLDLVNNNYQDFLSLGGSLKGGEEKIEEITVGLLGFRRDVEGLKKKIEDRRKEVEKLVDERRKIRKEVQLGRSLLEIDQRLEELEEKLMLVSMGANSPDNKDEPFNISDTEEESDGEEDASVLSVSRLQRRVQQYIYIKRLMEKVGAEHPFLIKQEERLSRLRQTLMLDLSNILTRKGSPDHYGKEDVLKAAALYRDMGESDEALRVLRK